MLSRLCFFIRRVAIHFPHRSLPGAGRRKIVKVASPLGLSMCRAWDASPPRVSAPRSGEELYQIVSRTELVQNASSVNDTEIGLNGDKQRLTVYQPFILRSFR